MFVVDFFVLTQPGMTFECFIFLLLLLLPSFLQCFVVHMGGIVLGR